MVLLVQCVLLANASLRVMRAGTCTPVCTWSCHVTLHCGTNLAPPSHNELQLTTGHAIGSTDTATTTPPAASTTDAYGAILPASSPKPPALATVMRSHAQRRRLLAPRGCGRQRLLQRLAAAAARQVPRQHQRVHPGVRGIRIVSNQVDALQPARMQAVAGSIRQAQ